VVTKSDVPAAIAKMRSKTVSVRRDVAELEEALAHQTRILSALREIGQALGTTLDLDQVLELILLKITEAVDADRATLYLLDDARGELVSRIAQGSEVRSIRLGIGEGIAGHVAKTGRAITVRDAYKDPRFSPQWDVLSGYRTRSILAAPLKNHLGKTIGVVQVLNKKPSARSAGTDSAEFTDDDADLLAAIAMQAAVSIDNSRLFLETVHKNLQLVETKEQLLRRVRDLKLLFSLESAMARAHSLEELFMAVLGEAMRSCEARAAAVALREPGEGEGEESAFLYLVDDKHRKLRRFPLREGQGLIGWSMSYGEVLIAADAPNDERTDSAFDDLVGFHSQTALIVPLEGEDRATMGAIALYNKRDRHGGFSGEDRSLLELIAANASTAIRLQMAREQHEREERLTTIGRLLSAVIHDLKTPLTVISGYVQLMQSADSKKKRAEYAEAALKQFDHISAMQREVLEFARGERNVLVRKVYLQKFFEEVRAAVEPQMKREGVELVISLQDKGTARFDEGKILRVVHNLARNAVEAMAPQGGGRFSIRVTRANKGTEEEELVITFGDTGPGIPREIEHRLFRSFVTANKKGGTGLGLAIVRKIADDHGGRVTVRSTKRGATFELRLPQGQRG
jgi:signal transduction histidine kinase/putative methionine-R-sulfoxide reductase with GAF domain